MSAPQSVPGARSLRAISPEAEPILLTAEQLEEINRIGKEMEERLERLKEELWEELERTCGPLVKGIDSIFYEEGDAYHTEIVYLFELYRYMVFLKGGIDYLSFFKDDVFEGFMNEKEILARLRPFNEYKVRSIERMLGTCNIEQKLIDFIPGLERELKDLEEKAEEGKKKKKKLNTALLEKVRKMSLKEFLSSWESIIDELDRNGLQKLADFIIDGIYDDNRFRNTLKKEIEELARGLLGAIDYEIDRIFSCLVEC